MRKLFTVCMLMLLLPTSAYAMEEVKVVGVKLVIIPGATFFSTGYVDDGSQMISELYDTSQLDPEDTITLDMPQFGCSHLNSEDVATGIFEASYVSRSPLQQIAWLAGIRANNSEWEVEWPDGSTGVYTIGLVPSSDPITSEECIEPDP